MKLVLFTKCAARIAVMTPKSLKIAQVNGSKREGYKRKVGEWAKN